MVERPSVIKRGWDESGMGKAMLLANTQWAECEEFESACKLEAEGQLFEKFTAKKKAELAEALLSARFSDLMGDEVEAEIKAAEASRDFTMEELQELDELHEPTRQDPEYEEMLPILRAQGNQYQNAANFNFSDETERTSTAQKKQKK